MSNVEERAIREYTILRGQRAEEGAKRSVRAVQNKFGIEAQPTSDGHARVDNLLFFVSADCTMRVRRDDWPEEVWRVVEDWASLGGALSTIPKPAEKAPASATLVLERIASVLEMVANSIIVKVN